MSRRPASPRFGEREAVELFAARFGGQANRTVKLGIGDDAALLSVQGVPLVLTVDAAVEETHFRRSLIAPLDLGWKSFHAAASDLAAMGARPVAALSALELPPRFSKAELDALARGQALAARAVGCPIVGGNVARAERLAITTTLVGTAPRPLTRAGALPGDELWLVGEVGLAALGFWLLDGGHAPGPAERRAFRRAVLAWRRPEALIRRGLSLVGRARAAVDVSDGLSGDLGHLARASGVRAVIEEARLQRALAPELVALAPGSGRSALDWALHGGEDYALVAAGPSAKRPRWARVIGRTERARAGVWLETSRGSRVALGRGFDHFAR
jgi:thiamine-monophosphate kinase